MKYSQGINIQIAIKQYNENKKSNSQNRLIHGHFHIGLVIIPRLPYWPETESRDINQVNMEMPKY